MYQLLLGRGVSTCFKGVDKWFSRSWKPPEGKGLRGGSESEWGNMGKG
jgi:hypothetical protein